MNNLNHEKALMVLLGIEPGTPRVEGMKVQTNPLSYAPPPNDAYIKIHGNYLNFSASGFR